MTPERLERQREKLRAIGISGTDGWDTAYPFECVQCGLLRSDAWRYKRGLPVCPDCGHPVRASNWLVQWYTGHSGAGLAIGP